MKRSVLTAVVVALVAVAIAVAGCGGGSSSSSGGGGGGGSIKIGDFDPQTGPYAFAGVPASKGATVAVEELNKEGGIEGEKIEFVNGHAGSEPQEAKNIVTNFAREGMTAIFGPIGDNVSPSIAPVIKALEIPDSSPTATTLTFTNDNPWTFTMGAPASAVGEGICETVIGLGPKNVATVVTSSNAGQVEFQEETMKCLEAKGVKSLDDETVTDSTTNFASVITNMKSSNPEAILIFLNGGSSAQFVTQARAAGIPASIRFVGPETMTGAEFLEVGGAAANGSIGVAAYASNSENPENKPFIENYEKRFNEEPEVFSAQGYGAMKLLIAGLEAAGKEVDKQKIVEGMEAVKGAPTVLGEGKLTISEGHLPEFGHVVVEVVEGGKLKILGN